MVQSMVLMEALVRQRKKLILTLAEQGQIFPWICIIKMKKVFFINEKEIFMFKTDNKNVISPTKFWLRSLSTGSHVTDSKAVSLEWFRFQWYW